jgi:purine nucleosidase
VHPIKQRTLRTIRSLGVIVAALVILLLLTFAIPIPVWRTGELPAPPLPLVKGGPTVSLSKRIWIDTDAACGHSRTTDPDDCFTLLLLAQADDVEIVGISTVHGNASLDITDRTTRDLVAMLERTGVKSPPVYRGSTSPAGDDGTIAPEPAHAALQQALEDGPLTLVALGPLTNVAGALNDRPDLQTNVERFIAVMGRRRGHLFHPAEGAGGGILFGHGPVFRDFNFDQDHVGATLVIGMRLPTALIPYQAARGISLTEADLSRLEAQGGAGTWVASRARGWLDFWEKDIGKDGFYPFDLLAGAYLLEPRFFDCAKAMAWVSKDDALRHWHWFYNPDALLVGVVWEMPVEVHASSSVVYCPQIDTQLHRWLMAQRTVPDPILTQRRAP